MKYSLIRDPEGAIQGKLDDFLSRTCQGNTFQSSDIFHFARSYKKWRPLFFGVEDEKGRICGVLLGIIQREKTGILGIFTARCIIIAGPVIDGDLGVQERQKIAGHLLDQFVSQVKKSAIYIQVRNLFSQADLASVFKNRKFQYLDHLNYIVDTTDRDMLEKKISQSKKRQIRQSLRNGARIIEPQRVEQVRDFYWILKDLYRKKVKKPLPGWDFFKEFYLQSRSGKLGKYFLIEYQHQVIGGIMCPMTLGKGIYEWYICGRDGEFKGIYPSVLATWAAIDYALGNNLEFFDFLGAGAPDKDYGVREFKSKFGGDLVNHGRYQRINRPWLYALGRLGVLFMEKLR